MPHDQIQAIVDQTITVGDIESAAVFAAAEGSPELRLVAAAGIAGPALDGLVAAVQRPDHPVARALSNSGPTFDVRPINPGGPALRSHLPLRRAGTGTSAISGVLAVAHDQPTSQVIRDQLVELAARAAEALG